MRANAWLWGCSLVLLLAGGGWANPANRGLIEAVRAQDHEAVVRLLQEQVDVNAPQPDGTTALHWTVYVDTLAITELLIDAGGNLNAANDYGVTPLALACDNAAGEMVERLLAAGANPNTGRTTGETPLMTCARTGNTKAVQALLARGADATATDPLSGQTALMWAVGERQTEVARVLIAHGADVHTRTKGDFTALLIAARTDEPALAGLLLDAGANVNVSAADGTTPLVVATVRGNAALAIFLLEQGADPNTAATGYTPLHWAAGSWHTELTGPNGIVADRDEEWRSLNGIKTGKLELVEALLAYGANPNARLAKTPPQFGYASPRFRVSITGATPFLLAAMDGNASVMHALVNAGADPLLPTEQNTTPLMVAAGLGRVPAESHVTEDESLEAVHLALQLGSEVNKTNNAGRTALHGASHIRSDALVQLLVDQGATVNTKDERGITPLMIAEGGGHIFLPGLGGGSTADLLRQLGSESILPSDFIEKFSQGQTRRRVQ